MNDGIIAHSGLEGYRRKQCALM